MDHVDRLCETLGEETRVCGELARVLREQQHAVVALRPDEVLACVERRVALSRELLAANATRRSALDALAVACGAEVARTDELLSRLPDRPRDRVRRAMGGLRTVLTETRSLERQTERLVRASLTHVQELVRTLAPLVPGARYGADAGVEAPAGPERLTRRV